MGVNYLSSERVILRPIAENDVDDIFSYRSLEVVAKYQYWETFTREDTLAFVRKNANSDLSRRNAWIGLAIVDRKEGRLIGDCAVRVGRNSAELGCNVSPQYQSKGYAKEALSLLCEFVFQCNNIDEVFAIIDAENVASVSLMKSLGMVKVADFEEKVICKGLLSIEHKYLLGRADWLTKNS